MRVSAGLEVLPEGPRESAVFLGFSVLDPPSALATIRDGA